MRGYTVGKGNEILLNGEHHATCDEPAKAVKLLQGARIANDVKRQYTKAARMIAEAEALPGFRWVHA